MLVHRDTSRDSSPLAETQAVVTLIDTMLTKVPLIEPFYHALVWLRIQLRSEITAGTVNPLPLTRLHAEIFEYLLGAPFQAAWRDSVMALYNEHLATTSVDTKVETVDTGSWAQERKIEQPSANPTNEPLVMGLFECHSHQLKWTLSSLGAEQGMKMMLELNLRTEDGIVCLDAVIVHEKTDVYRRAFSETFLRTALALALLDPTTSTDSRRLIRFSANPELKKLLPGGLESAIVTDPRTSQG